MAGGIGSRFWPLSTPEFPKQFIDILGCGRTLIQLTVDRFKGVCPMSNFWVVTNAAYVDIVRQQLPDMPADHILAEPAARNTAPCIAWACWRIRQESPDANVVVTPADAVVMNPEEFRRVITNALSFTERHNTIVTIGIKPSRPETGYGYIQVGEPIEGNFSKVKTFTEKPDEDLARVFLKSGEFFWNSGMFFWSTDSIIKALDSCAPDVNTVFEQGKEYFGTPQELDYINANFEASPSISIDFAVMEKAPNVYVETVDFGWNDLGTWRSLYDHSPKNIEGNVTQNCKALMLNSHNNIVALKGDKVIVASGLEGYIVADVDDALLIVPLEEEQKIKTYVNEVKSKFGDKYL